MGPEEREIREIHSTWIDAINAGTLARLLTLMADDVVSPCTASSPTADGSWPMVTVGTPLARGPTGPGG